MQNLDRIQLILQKVVATVNPSQVYLFGSQADGTATANSDIDLLVVADVPGSPRQRSLALRRLFPHRNYGLDIFVLNPSEFERQRALVNSLGYIATQKGRLLYVR